MEAFQQDDGFHWGGEDIGTTLVSNDSYQQSNRVQDRGFPDADGWVWDEYELDATMEMDMACYAQRANVIAPPALVQEDWSAEEAYEDPTIDMAQASSGPVQANAPPVGNQPQEDLWTWDDEALELLLGDDPLGPDQPPYVIEDAWLDPDDTTDDFDASTDPVGDDQPPLPAEDLSLDETLDDDAWPDSAPVADVVAVATDAPQDPDADFAEDVADDAETDSQPVGADAPLVVDGVPLDAWWEEDGLDDTIDDSSPVVLDAPALESAPWWEDDAGEDLAEDGAPVVADVPALDATAWWDDETNDDIADESAPVPDLVVVQQDALPQDAWPDDDAIDEFADESGPVVNDAPVVVVDALASEAWWEDDASDESIDESAPVGGDVVIVAEPLPQEAWFDDEVHDEPIDDSAPVPTGDLATSDDYLFDDEVEDALPIDDMLGPDEEPIAASEAWAGEDEAPDDDWVQSQNEHALIDPVLLPGLTFQETWDWSGDDTDDDTHWFEQVQPDAGALPADTCPAQLAAAMARIAELEALLAAALAAAGTGGGGASGDGDDVDGGRDRYDSEQRDILDRREQERRRRIDQNNAMILAIVASTVQVKHPKGST